jgi:hypothetical protein
MTINRGKMGCLLLTIAAIRRQKLAKTPLDE